MANLSGVFRRIPRQEFIPDVIWIDRDDGWLVPLNRVDDPDAWAALVDSGESLIIQVDDGRPADKGAWPTSSSSAPEVMLRMLDALDIRSGMRVLEIGTGSGYNAALLAEIAGPGKVTTVEIDESLAEHAQRALDASGHPVKVVVADGADGHPPGAPYDRVIVTAAVHEVPYAWIEQTRPGGLVLVPWAQTVHPDCPLVALPVHADGTAEGRFGDPGWFMPLRGQRLSQREQQETAERWAAMGKPDATRFGVTVTAEGQRVWLDAPDNPIP